MPADPRRVKDLFIAALDIADPGERAAFLDRECGADAELRRRLDVLLAAHDQPDAALGQPFRAPAVEDDATRTANPQASTAALPDPAAVVGTIVAGRYKLLQQIGEGGMGTVWMADQLEPVKRRVAVKLIRAERGNSATILSRFEAERQAIALMDHPHIAKLLDAGTADGAPFFVMELVKGIPLTEYCDTHRLSVPERLNLFMQICSAVQHAHQKGIIHRDLKPTNILVESHDDKPVPKVIDFGLAKATSGLQLTEHTLFTGFGSVMGTPLYMAPEQATFNAIDIDTRADIYALGVILYELLTGTTPLTRETIKQAALDEMLRLIREQDAPTPSSRLSSSEAKPTVAANRQTEPAKLGRFVKGELDWIVMKALSKERDRRYETANGFAKDVERFLSHEPVLAGPPSTAYKLRKFVQRNKGQVIATSLVLFALVAGIAGTTFGLIEAKRQEKYAFDQFIGKEIARKAEAEQREIAEEKAREALKAAEEERQAKEREAAQRVIAVEQRAKAEKARDRTRDVLDAMVSEVTGDSLTTQKEISAEQKKFLQGVLGYYREFAGENADDAHSRWHHARTAFRVGLIEFRLGRKEQSAAAYRIARDGYASLAVDFPTVRSYQSGLAASQSNLGMLLADLGQREEAVKQYRKGLVIFEKLAIDFPAVSGYQNELANIHNSLGNLLKELGKRTEAEEQYRKAVAITQKLANDFQAMPSYRHTLATTHNNLGILLNDCGQSVEAEEQYRKGLAIFEKLAANFPAVPAYRRGKANSHNNMGVLFADLGQRAEAEAQYRHAQAIREKLVADFPAVPTYQVELGLSYRNSGTLLSEGGNPAESLKWFGRAIDCVQPVHEKEPRDVTAKLCLRDIYAGRAASHFRLQKFAEAVQDWDRAIALSPPDEQPRYRANRATSRVLAGMVIEAVAEVAELTKSQKWNAAQWYDFACVYSVASGKIADKKQEYVDRAMELLYQAVQAGYKNTALIKTDADLAPLRDRADFQKLFADLAAKYPPPPEPAPPPREKK